MSLPVLFVPEIFSDWSAQSVKQLGGVAWPERKSIRSRSRAALRDLNCISSILPGQSTTLIGAGEAKPPSGLLDLSPGGVGAGHGMGPKEANMQSRKQPGSSPSDSFNRERQLVIAHSNLASACEWWAFDGTPSLGFPLIERLPDHCEP